MFFKKQKINDSEVMRFGFLGGIAQAFYCFGAVMFIKLLSTEVPKPFDDSIIAPLLVLLFFVFSAAVSAILIFGYPAYLAAQKRYFESLMTVCTTLATLAIIAIMVFAFASIIYG